MLFTTLNELVDSKDKRILERKKRIMEIALIDPYVKFALKINSSKKMDSKDLQIPLTDIWEAEVNFVNSRDVLQKLNVGFKKVIKFKKLGSPLKNEDILSNNFYEIFLTLDTEAVKSISVFGEYVSSIFPSLIITYEKNFPKEIYPIKTVKNNSGQVEFIIGEENKNSKLELVKVLYKTQDLFIFVEINKTEHKDELLKLLPKLNHIPLSIQNKLTKFPKKFSKRSERLNQIVDVYKKTWGNTPLKKENILTEKWNYEIYNHKDYIKTNKINSEYELISLQGKKLGKFSSKIIFPDFLIKDIHKQPKQISFSTPVKLWIVLCVAEFFWKNIDEINEKTHPVGKHIEKFFYRINNDDAKQSDKIEKDYIEFLKKYPEVRYFSDVKFRSDSVLAASLTRPSWADSKFKNFRRN